MLLAASLAVSQATPHSGAELFERNCTGCHTAGSPTHAPAPETLRQMSRTQIFDALTTGKMILVANSLPVIERMKLHKSRALSVGSNGRKAVTRFCRGSGLAGYRY
jgi:hypothetical protein